MHREAPFNDDEEDDDDEQDNFWFSYRKNAENKNHSEFYAESHFVLPFSRKNLPKKVPKFSKLKNMQSLDQNKKDQHKITPLIHIFLMFQILSFCHLKYMMAVILPCLPTPQIFPWPLDQTQVGIICLHLWYGSWQKWVQMIY